MKNQRDACTREWTVWTLVLWVIRAVQDIPVLATHQDSGISILRSAKPESSQPHHWSGPTIWQIGEWRHAKAIVNLDGGYGDYIGTSRKQYPSVFNVLPEVSNSETYA